MDIDRKLLRVLFVEDSEVDRLAFERFVRKNKLPYEYSVAASVAEGRMLLESHRFDVVLLDYMLGDGTGFDLLDFIRSDTPVIFVTGTGDEETAAKAIKSGAVDYLIKDPEGNYLTILPVTVDNAIRAKKLEKEVKRYQSRLEDMVEERTIQLQEANEQLRGEILERTQTEERLKESEEKYRKLIETTSEGFWLLNSEKKTIDVNQSLCDMLGYTRNEMIGKIPVEFTDADNRKIFEESLSKIPTTLHRSYEILLKRKNGINFPAIMNATSLFDKKGKLTGSFAFVNDITDRKQAESRLKEQLAELQRWHNLTLGRESRILDLKSEVNELLGKADQPPRYPSAESQDKKEK